jgi:hypothetical protein
MTFWHRYRVQPTIVQTRVLVGVGMLSIAAFLWTRETTIPHPATRNLERTIEVTGQILVDGKPEKDVFVYLVPENGPIISSGQSQGDGSFVIGTYTASDGAPAGAYKVTLRWLTYNQFGRPRWGAPDRLHDRYSDHAKSEFVVTVATMPIRDLSFNLTNRHENATSLSHE